MKFSEQETKLMRVRGLPGYILSETEFKVDDFIQTYTSTLEKLTPMTIKKTNQVKYLKDILEDPTHAPYTACISSEPNDLRAKIIGSQIMQRCIQEDKEVLWHTVIGGYKDDLRDNTKYWKRKLDCLIIANFLPDSTEMKYEKVRDLLELYSDIPRIILTTQAEPYAFFNAMGIPLNYGIHIRSKRCRKAL